MTSTSQVTAAEREGKLFDKIREAASHTLIYGLGAAIQTALNFVFIPLYTRYYTTSMYGALSLINLCGTLAGAVFCLGTASALARSYYDYEDERARKEVVSTALYLAVAGAALQVFFGAVLCKPLSMSIFRSQEYAVHIFLVMVSSAFTFINSLFFMVLRFQKRSKHVIALDLISLLLTSMVTLYLLMVLKRGIMAPIMGGLIAQGAVCGLMLLLIRDCIVLGYSKRELRVQLSFGIQSVLIGLAYYLLDAMNRFFINGYCSLSDVGIYSLGDQIASALSVLFIIPFGQIWAPMRMQYRNERNADEFYGRMLTYYVALGLVLTVAISFFSKELILILGGHREYVRAYRVVPFLVLGTFIYGFLNFIEYGIVLSRKVIYISYILVFAAMILFGLNSVFIKRGGYMAAGAAILFCNVIIATLVYLVSSKFYRLSLEGRRLAALGSIYAVILSVGSFVYFDAVAAELLFKSTLILMMAAAIWRFVLIDDEKRALLASISHGIYQCTRA